MSRSPYRSYRDLNAYPFLYHFTLHIHDTIKRDPVEEEYGLVEEEIPIHQKI